MLNSHQNTHWNPILQQGRREARAAHILVVDDHREIAELVADTLAEEGYTVRVAHDGIGALQAIRENRPDLLLLDLSMPRMSGDELLRRLQADGLRDLPVILMTADRSPERLASLAVDLLLTKPFDIDHLIEAVAAILKPTRTQPSGGNSS